MKKNKNLISGVVSVLIMIILIIIEPLSLDSSDAAVELLGLIAVFVVCFFIVRFLLSRLFDSKT
jgi:hypothetical protein